MTHQNGVEVLERLFTIVSNHSTVKEKKEHIYHQAAQAFLIVSVPGICTVSVLLESWKLGRSVFDFQA